MDPPTLPEPPNSAYPLTPAEMLILNGIVEKYPAKRKQGSVIHSRYLTQAQEAADNGAEVYCSRPKIAFGFRSEKVRRMSSNTGCFFLFRMIICEVFGQSVVGLVDDG